MQRLTDINLKKSLGDRTQKLYFVAGNDSFLVNGCVRTIIKHLLGDSRDGLVRFSQKALSDGGLEEMFYSFSMLGQHQVALVEDFGETALRAAEKKLLEELLPTIPDELTVILRYVSSDKRFSVPKTLQDIAALNKDSALVTVTSKEGAELLRYIGHIASREGCEIDPKAEREIAALCGDDLQLISSELKKLAALADYKTITKEHVDALGIRTAEAGVYKMLSALESGDTRQASALLQDMLDDLSEPLSITAVLNTAFINLYRARLTRDAGHSMNYMVDHFNYRKGDRRLSIAYDRCLRYPVKKLERVIGILSSLDRELKSSVVDTRYILERRVVEISSVVAS